MTKAMRQTVAFFYAALAVTLVAASTLRFWIAGLVGSVLFIGGLLVLLLEGERQIDRLVEKLTYPTFNRVLKRSRAEFSKALEGKFSRRKRIELKDRLLQQCKLAGRLDEQWELLVARDETLRASEADAVVQFEEQFAAVVKKLVEDAKTVANEKSMATAFQEGAKLLNEFGYYLMKLDIELEMG